jgi:hypothetical protein
MGWMAPLRHLGAKVLVGREPPANREPSMNGIRMVSLTCGQSLHWAEADITKCRGGSGFDPERSSASILCRTSEALLSPYQSTRSSRYDVVS